MSEDVTRVIHQEPPDDRGRGGGRGDDGRGWMVATVALIALLVGLGAGLLVNSGDDEPTRTIRRTVTAAAGTPPTATKPEPTTVTERSVTTIVRTVPAPAETVTVTVPTETATDGEG
jgi:hypothetical protein